MRGEEGENHQHRLSLGPTIIHSRATPRSAAAVDFISNLLFILFILSFLCH